MGNIQDVREVAGDIVSTVEAIVLPTDVNLDIVSTAAGMLGGAVAGVAIAVHEGLRRDRAANVLERAGRAVVMGLGVVTLGTIIGKQYGSGAEQRRQQRFFT